MSLSWDELQALLVCTEGGTAAKSTNGVLDIADNICGALNCTRSEIENILPLVEGLTNLSFRFTCKGNVYVYRHPGAGTEEIINRKSEAYSQSVAKKLGIDDTFVYEDAEKGWKLSIYLDGCIAFDYHNPDHIDRGLALARTLHTSGEVSAWTFDVYEKTLEIIALLQDKSYPLFDDFDELRQRASKLNDWVKADGVASCLCHNDFYQPNFLVLDEAMYLIDWEYSAMSDYASDLGTFICCSDYTLEEAEEVIGRYFGREPSESEMRHCLAYVGISAYYWFIWALFKEAAGDSVGEWLSVWYQAAKTYGSHAEGLYEAATR